VENALPEFSFITDFLPKFLGVLFFSFIFISNLFSQLSPGKLSKAHAKLEGLTNCTQCHTLGAQISEQKCLTCHKELNAQISKNKGFHVSNQVKGKGCVTCHNEHHGLNFEMIRFDKKAFNHNLTGFELKGAHKTKVTNCNECHKPENIVIASLKNKPKTYLGLDTKCLNCHDDYHQKTLSNDCISCHNANEWKPATLFNHNKADFTLNGAHKKVECKECHKEEIRDGKKFVKYADIAHSNCFNCHKDVHHGDFGTNCKSCHNEDSFHKISASTSFNHNVTGFKLEGKHDEINCKKCHDSGNSTFQEFAKKKDITCANCHKDIHEGKFGTDCKSCHNQTSFLLKKAAKLDKFDHDKTDYKLEGKHIEVDCRTCHKKDLTDALPHKTCMDCHSDKHNGDFDTKKSLYPDCATCHKVEAFSPSFFTIEQHNTTKFKLDGAHLAQPCFTCHLKADKKWVFSNLGTECVSCHTDIHKDIIDNKYYGENSCVTCHTTESWQAVTFNHDSTGYKLVGAHQKASCGGCHIDKTLTHVRQAFRGLKSQCSLCHEDAHGNQFAKRGITNCEKCHNNETWEMKNFDHDKNTDYKLDGEHKKATCSQCHKQIFIAGTDIKLFKIVKHNCIDCHLK
jgi:hypothetical protein